MKIDFRSIVPIQLPRAIKGLFSVPFLYLALLYLVLRLAMAVARLPYIYTHEDLFTMKLVVAWSRGQPVWEMVRPSAFNFGGDLLNALLFYPFGRLFWPSYFSIKVFAILEGLAIMGMWYYLIRICYGRGPAIIFGLLFTFAPHYFVHYTMISYGYHFETGLVQVAACILFVRLLSSDKAGGSRIRMAIAVGTVIGIGLFWSYLFHITLGAIGAVWLLVDARRIGLKPSLVAVSTSLLIAAALYWGTGTGVHFWGAGLGALKGLRPEYLSALWHNIFSISGGTNGQIPDLSLCPCDILFGNLIGLANPGSAIYRVMLIFAMIALIRLAMIAKRKPQRLLALLVLFDIVFFYLAYTHISFFRFGNPYLVTLYPFVFAAIALVPALFRSPVLRILYGLVLSVILSLSLCSSISIIKSSKLGTFKDFRGMEYLPLATGVYPYMVSHLNTFLDWYKAWPTESEQLYELYEGFTDGLNANDQLASMLEEPGIGPDNHIKGTSQSIAKKWNFLACLKKP